MGDQSWIQFYFSSGDVLSACHGFTLSWVTAVHQLNPKSQINSGESRAYCSRGGHKKNAVGSGFGISFGREIQVQNMWEVHPFHRYSYSSQKSVKETQLLTTVITENSGCQESRPKPTDRFLNCCGAAIFSFLASKSSVFFQRSNLKCRAWRRRLSGNCLGCCWPATTTTTKKNNQRASRTAGLPDLPVPLLPPQSIRLRCLGPDKAEPPFSSALLGNSTLECRTLVSKNESIWHLIFTCNEPECQPCTETKLWVPRFVAAQ